MSYQMLQRSFFFTFLILFVSACGGGGGGGDDDNNTTTTTIALPEGPLPVVFMADDATATPAVRGVYRALDDGSSLLRIDSRLELLPNQPLPRDFKVSPNREWVAILASDVGSVEVGLYTASMDGGTLNEIVTVTLTGPRTLEDYVWSPTGDALAYVVDQDNAGVHEVYFAMADGSATSKISSPVTASDNRDFKSPVWSPDGRYVMFEVHSLASGKTEGIEVYDRDNPTPAATEITTGIPGPFELIQNLQWSPDSIRVAFIYSSPTTSTFELWSSLADGSGSSQINPDTISGGTGVRGYDWSPDGSEIAYISRQRNTFNSEVFVAGFDGSSLTIQHTPFSDTTTRGARDVKWSPDGTYLAYTSNHMVDANSYQLYVVTNRTDNRDAAVLQSIVGSITKWEWMPDSSSIVYLGTSFSSVPRIYRKDALELHSTTSPPDADILSATELFNSGDASDFELSPDSKNIAFLKFRSNSDEDELYGNPTAGNNRGELLNTPFGTFNKNLDVYQWSPAGDRVMHAVTTLNAAGNAIQSIAVFATDPDGSNRVLLSGSFNAVLVGGLTRASY